MRYRALSLIAVVLLAGGCASLGGDETDGSQFDCPRGLTRPFSVHTLIRAANGKGVSLKLDRDCGGITDSVERASNIVIGDAVRDDDEIEAHEGAVFCDVDDLPFDVRPFKVTRTKYADDDETHLDVANVRCAIYPSAEGQIARLQAVLEAVAAAPVETKSCPSARPEPVTVKRLMDSARRHGLRLLPEARCIEPGVVAQASTRIPYLPVSPNEDHVFYDQGDVTCLLRRSATPGAKKLETTPLSVGKRFELLNVSCTVRPSLGAEEVQVGRVQATIEDLERVP
jgi:hypothetical protein